MNIKDRSLKEIMKTDAKKKKKWNKTNLMTLQKLRKEHNNNIKKVNWKNKDKKQNKRPKRDQWSFRCNKWIKWELDSNDNKMNLNLMAKTREDTKRRDRCSQDIQETEYRSSILKGTNSKTTMIRDSLDLADLVSITKMTFKIKDILPVRMKEEITTVWWQLISGQKKLRHQVTSILTHNWCRETA